MAALRLRQLSSGVAPILALFALLLVSLYLMSAATQNSEEFGRLYFSLLLINILGLVTLVVLIGANLARLIRQYRKGAAGSRLTVRLVVMFVILALVPVSLVYYFSLGFIERGIDSWFDVQIEKAFDDALELSRLSLDERKREYLRRTRQIGADLTLVPDEQMPLVLNDLRAQNDVYELTMMTASGGVIGFSSLNPLAIMPNLPSDAVLRQVRRGETYVNLDPVGDDQLYVRILLELPGLRPVLDTRLLQAMFPVSGRVNELTNSVEDASSRYKQLAYLRKPLKYSFMLTLSLVLLLSLLSAVWAAFFSARRLVAPVRVLAIGTRAVAAGDYDRQLPQHSSDELGFLVRSFNDMTRRLAQARDEARQSQQQAESERAYLRAVLGRLSSGVLTLDKQRIVRTANAAAGHILGIDPKDYIASPLVARARDHEHLRPFIEAIRPHLAAGESDWRREVILYGPSGKQVLMCGGASLPDHGHRWTGNVLVVEDVTALVQAQRDAAWGEVARRLAHEIKNPLTPIRLSAERLRRKYMKEMSPQDADILDRSTHTIVQQVEVMQEMVKAFSDYARTPQLKLRPLDLNVIIGEVLDLYRGDAGGARFETEFDPGLPLLRLDSGRIRQLLHNLIKNSIEAAEHGRECHILLRTAVVAEGGVESVELRVRDNGPGLPAEMIGRYFEPYFTTKHKGSGLGLAVVKKIVEEHGGMVWAENAREGGALIVARFPMEMNPAGETGAPGQEGAGDAPAPFVPGMREHKAQARQVES
ncbi:MAG: HAMP domain-containing protein [Gammaproteobacteria bacterium]|nr:HAMP domain-containing protein [Gammaproteobacteria bacterium]